MNVSISDLKTNAGKYVNMAEEQEICITRNGKRVAKLIPFKTDKKASAKALIGALPGDVDYDALREERILK